jgi:large subunit ribosomal protein L23
MSRNRAAKLLSDPYSILRRPILTEKSHDMIAAGGGDDEAKKGKAHYTFEVHIKANKHQIKKAVEAAFGVTVAAVNTMIVKPRQKAFRGAKAGRPGFTRQRKKAVIRLTKDSKQIELM